MTLVVEDGTGLSTAEAYISEADADIYFDGTGENVAWDAVVNKEIALRTAAQHMRAKYGTRWQGRRVRQEQALDWPRYNVADRDGWYVDSDIVPVNVQRANAILALKTATDTLSPDQSSPGTIKSEAVKLGSIAETIVYDGGKDQETHYTLVERLLSEFLEAAGEIFRG